MAGEAGALGALCRGEAPITRAKSGPVGFGPEYIFMNIFFCSIFVKKKKKNKLGLSWAKLSYQLGFDCHLTIILCIILINTEQFWLV